MLVLVLVLVTGRELDDLIRCMPRLDLFDIVVAENGALLYWPATKQERTLVAPPPPGFAHRLREAGLSPLSAGRVIVASWEPNEGEVLATIRGMVLELQIIFNMAPSWCYLPEHETANRGHRIR